MDHCSFTKCRVVGRAKNIPGECITTKTVDYKRFQEELSGGQVFHQTPIVRTKDMVICDKIPTPQCFHIVVNNIYTLGEDCNHLENLYSQSYTCNSSRVLNITLLDKFANVITPHNEHTYYSINALLTWITIFAERKKNRSHRIFDNLYLYVM